MLLLYEDAIRTLRSSRLLIRTRSIENERRMQILSASMLNRTIDESLESCESDVHQWRWDISANCESVAGSSIWQCSAMYFNGTARVLAFVTLSLENPLCPEIYKSLDFRLLAFFLCLLYNQSATPNFSYINNDHLSTRGTLKIIHTHYAFKATTTHFTRQLFNIIVQVNYSPPSYHASRYRSRCWAWSWSLKSSGG